MGFLDLVVGEGTSRLCQSCGLSRMVWASGGRHVVALVGLALDLVDQRTRSSSLKIHPQRLLLMQLVEVVSKWRSS